MRNVPPWRDKPDRRHLAFHTVSMSSGTQTSVACAFRFNTFQRSLQCPGGPGQVPRDTTREATQLSAGDETPLMPIAFKLVEFPAE